MTLSRAYHCVVDDTALITNISEIEQWVLRGLATLVIPLHTLERLHILKKDTSQIGMNARKAVKFLDQVTSKEDLPHDAVIIQGPDDQYETWAEVEAHYMEQHPSTKNATGTQIEPHLQRERTEMKGRDNSGKHSANRVENDVSQVFLEKLQIEKSPNVSSPVSTPPLSPSSSEPQSSKTSPEVKSADLTDQDVSPVPPSLKALINSAVWYTFEKKDHLDGQGLVLLTNSADTAQFARDFGVTPKTIHQLRVAIGVEEQEVKNQTKFHKKHNSGPNTSGSGSEGKTLFRYEEDSTDEEEVVFKPRARGSPRVSPPARAVPVINPRPRSSHGRGHSPANSLTMSHPPPPKPQIPVEEIDPDSFDRGVFGRGSTPLVSVGNQTTNSFTGNGRGHHRGNGNVGRNNPHRGSSGKGGSRGRGRLFVP